jgi:PST family polysaccharide transporter
MMKQFFKVTILSGVYTLLKMIVGFIISKFIAIYTGPAGIAMLGQVQSIMTITTGVAAAPVGTGLVRYTAENWQKGEVACSPWWTACLRITLIFLVVLIPTIVLFSGSLSSLLFDNQYYSWLIVLSACVLPFSVVNILIASVINGQQKYRQYILLGMLSVLIATGVMILLIIYFGLTGALIATTLYTAIAGIVLIFFCINKKWFRLNYWFVKIDTTHLKPIINYTLMALVTAAAMPLALLTVRKILIENAGWENAGHWQAVWKISEVYLGVITIALSTYLLPRLAALKEVNLVRKEINSISIYVFTITAILAIIVYYLRDVSITILFTEDFREARNLFLYQLIGDVIKISGFLYAYPLLAQGKIKVYVASEIIFSCLFVIFGFIFIRYYGVQGANLGYLFNYSLYFIFAYTYTNYVNTQK